MKFEEVLPALREGKKITSEHLKKCGYQYIYYKGGTVFDDKGGYWHLTNCELVESNDWEIVKKKKKVKVRDLPTTWNAKITSFPTFSYSDEYLDQEIEIEE